jgi:Tol biopolymer transport system component
MITVRVALGIAVIGASLTACGEDTPSPPDQKLVYVERPGGGMPGGQVVSVAANGEQRQVLWQSQNPGTDPFFALLYPSPSGRTILFLDYSGAPNGWYTLPTTGGNRTPFVAPADAIVPEWSPDESAIAWIIAEPRMRIGIATPGSASVSLVTPDSLFVAEKQWSPDGTRLAFRAYDPDNSVEQHIYTVSRTGGPILPLATDPDNRDFDPAWSPSGEFIAFVRQHNGISENNGVWVSHPDGSNQRLVTAGIFAATEGLFWSPDGTELIASESSQGHVRINFSTGAQAPIERFRGTPAANPWSPDGTRITYGGRTLPETNGNTGPSVVVATPSGTQEIQVSPDSAYGSGQVWLPPVR